MLTTSRKHLQRVECMPFGATVLRARVVSKALSGYLLAWRCRLQAIGTRGGEPSSPSRTIIRDYYGLWGLIRAFWVALAPLV